MEALALTTATATATATATTNPSHIRFLAPSHTPTTTTTRRSIRNVSFRRKPNKYLVFASNEDLKLDELDKLELKFGRLIGEDPKLTLAKIRSKKLNPHVSYLEVEKSFYKNKGKLVEIEDVSEKGKSTNSLSGVKLVRPVPKEGVKFETDNKPIKIEVKKPSPPVRKPVENMRGSLPNIILRKPTTFNEDIIEPQESSKWASKPNLLWPSQPVRKPVENMRDSLPNVILRKPTTFNEDIVEPQESKWRSNPNLLLKMGNKKIQDKSSDIDLLKKPEPMSGNFNVDKKQESVGDAKAQSIDDIEAKDQRTASTSTEATNMVRLLKKPTQTDLSFSMNEKQESSVDLSAEMVNTEESNYAESMETGNESMSSYSGLEDCSTSGLQPLEQSDVGFSEKITSDTKSMDSNIKIAVEAALQGKPNMLDQSVKATSNFSREEIGFVKHESNSIAVKLEDFLATSPIKEQEDIDWKRVEYLVETGEREEVELISSSIRGFVVSFGSLVGFLPYRSLATRCKYLAFESWLRRKGLDPSKYKKSLGIIGNNGIATKTSLDSNLNTAIDRRVDVDISPDMKLEDLLWIYDQEKLKFLKSFVGQKMKVNVVLADRKSRRLIVSSKPKENDEVVEKKRSLMAKLSIGDIVKCCIKKITYFGIFVEVEGVPALIHQTEVSWDATLDPASYFRVGQIVEAKVHQLDFSVRRIFLSLREMTPDPVIENLEAVNGDLDSLDGRLEAAQEDTEWADVDSLIKELQQFEGIQSVSKGRFFLSQGLAPTFQVYMASVFANEYKLLARSGNKVQEVIVQTSLGKEEMKSAILTCTNRV